MPTRYEFEHGWWESALCAPHESLRGIVHGPYVGWTQHTTMPVTRREVAGTIIPIILNLSSPYRIVSGHDDAPRSVIRHSFVAGLYDTWVAVEGARESSALQVNLTPLGARAMLAVPMHELVNRVVAIDDVFGARASTLIERLINAPSWRTRFVELDRFLCERLANADAPSPHLLWAWDQLANARGTMPIASLATSLGWSPKRLISHFRDGVGLPPKTIARLMRFEDVVQRIGAQPSVHWSALAYDCGYSDQSHLHRDFVEFAGCTPVEYLRTRLPDGGGIVA